MPDVDTKEFWVNMPNLMSHLRRVADQKPQATYYNVDMIKYQVRGSPLHHHIHKNDSASWVYLAQNFFLEMSHCIFLFLFIKKIWHQKSFSWYITDMSRGKKSLW